MSLGNALVVKDVGEFEIVVDEIKVVILSLVILLVVVDEIDAFRAMQNGRVKQ
jgi:hypothetical protein